MWCNSSIFAREANGPGANPGFLTTFRFTIDDIRLTSSLSKGNASTSDAWLVNRISYIVYCKSSLEDDRVQIPQRQATDENPSRLLSVAFSSDCGVSVRNSVFGFEFRRNSVPKPRVASHELPWEFPTEWNQPQRGCGLGTTPSGLT